MESKPNRPNVPYRFPLTITIPSAVIGFVMPFLWWFCAGSKSATEVPVVRVLDETRLSAYWEEAIASDPQPAPGLEHPTMDSEPPVKPDAAGNDSIVMPGRTETVRYEPCRYSSSPPEDDRGYSKNLARL